MIRTCTCDHHRRTENGLLLLQMPVTEEGVKKDTCDTEEGSARFHIPLEGVHSGVRFVQKKGGDRVSCTEEREEGQEHKAAFALTSAQLACR